MRLFKPIIFLFAISFAFNSFGARVNQFGIDTKVCDLVLIYTGGMTKRANWTKENLMPYVVHTYSDGSEDWFYDAFIFNEISWKGRSLHNALGSAPGYKTTWIEYLDHLFAEDHDLGALDKLISEKKKTLGEPRLKHKIIISYCVPCMYYSYRVPDGSDVGFQWTDFVWGSIDGKEINFKNAQDRLAAVKWYVDEVIRRFEEKNYENLELVGFYSVEESMNPRVSNGDMQAEYNDYVASLGLRSYWIPYWWDNDTYATVWKEKYHFDMAYRQPNYFFYTNSGSLPDYSQLTSCIKNSKLYGLGLELEFETAETSNGLHEVSPAMHQRLIDYIDAFEENGVWESSGVAHYGGSVGYINMAKSNDPVNHATMDRLADLVIKRQSAFSGVDDAKIADQHRSIACAGNGEIFVSAEFPTACVYDVAGHLLHEGWGRFACPKGMYIVTDGKGNTTKLFVCE